jgi:hypothetical protein
MTGQPTEALCEDCLQRRRALDDDAPFDLPHVLDDLEPVELVTKPTIELTRAICQVCGCQWTIEAPTDPDKPATLRYGWG